MAQIQLQRSELSLTLTNRWKQNKHGSSDVLYLTTHDISLIYIYVWLLTIPPQAILRASLDTVYCNHSKSLGIITVRRQLISCHYYALCPRPERHVLALFADVILNVFSVCNNILVSFCTHIIASYILVRLFILCALIIASEGNIFSTPW